MYLRQQFKRGKLLAVAFSIVFSSSVSAGPGNYNQQGPRLVGTGAVGPSHQGESASLSADGNTAIIGGTFDNNFLGAAWVFARSNGVWTQQGAKLVGTGTSTLQGVSVALSADGNTAAVGGSRGAFVFTRSGSVWTQQGSELVGAGKVLGAFGGVNVAISGDGNTLVVGDHWEADSHGGGVWLFTRSGGVWSQQGNELVIPYRVPLNFPEDHAIFDLAISADGSTIAVGEFANDTDSQAYGTRAIARSGGSLTSQPLCIIPPLGRSECGQTVSLTADGNTLLVDNLLLYRKGGVWSKDGPQGAPGPRISADGSTVVQVVGGQAPNIVATIVKTAGVWGFRQVYAGTGQGSNATSVALSANGNTMVEGGGFTDNDLVGGAWVFATPELSTSLTHAANFSHGQTNAKYTITVKNIGDREIHAAPTSAVNVIDKLPAGLIATAISGPGWNCTLSSVSCTRQDGLGIGASFPSVTVTVTVAGSAASKVTNVATASGGGSNWGNANDVTFIVP